MPPEGASSTIQDDFAQFGYKGCISRAAPAINQMAEYGMKAGQAPPTDCVGNPTGDRS